jgi:hypothetical protein
MKVNLNNKSVNQGGPSMMQPQQQVDPAILQISEFFSTSVDEGKKPEEVVISLMEQEVDQNTIAQALMNMGYAEEDLTILFKNVESLTKPKPPSNQQINNNPQQLSRDQAIQEGRPAMVSIDPIEMANDGKETGNCTPEQIASGTCGAMNGTNLVVNMNSQGVIQNPNINTNNDEGMIGGSPMYVNPAAFAENGNKKNLGSIANFLLESNETLFDGDLNSAGEKKGALRDWKTKALNNKIDKQLNANYTATLDFSDENIGAIGNWYNQYMEENPERNELDQIINNIPPPEETKITKAGNKALDWMNDKGADLTGSAKETYDALRKKLGFRYGGDLDKAQYGDFSFPQEQPFIGPMEYTAQDTVDMNDQLRADDAEAAYQEANRVPSADELFAKINMPTVEADYGGLQGTIDRALDSNLAKGFGAISDVVVKGSGLLTDFLDTSVEDAKVDNYNTFALADNVYGTKTNAFNKRGKTDINTGQSGSDSDKVTGLFMSKGGGVNNEGFKALPSAVQHNILSNMSTGGDGPSRNEVKEYSKVWDINKRDTKAVIQELINKGANLETDTIISSYQPSIPMEDQRFGQRMYNLATNVNSSGLLPFMHSSSPNFAGELGGTFPFIDATGYGSYLAVPKNEFGGERGEAAYLANRDRVIKREMGKAQFGNGETEGMRQREGSYNAPNRKYTLDPRFKKEGGETVSVDPSMLAKLIAAGADIEML